MKLGDFAISTHRWKFNHYIGEDMKSKLWFIAGALLSLGLAAVVAKPADASVCQPKLAHIPLDLTNYTVAQYTNGVLQASGNVSAGGTSGYADLIWQKTGVHYHVLTGMLCQNWQNPVNKYNRAVTDPDPSSAAATLLCDYHSGQYDTVVDAAGYICPL